MKEILFMKLNDIFDKPVDRPIEGVIKADDLASLKNEVEEYVFTNEISQRLSRLFEAYNEYHGANGVWISGFFGSGKSHLLKMLALLLENQTIDGRPALAYFLPKCGGDAMLQGEMKRAGTIPARSILFNIDQKADTITKTETDAVLAVFVKVFNEMCGYYGKQGYVAQFERDLDGRGALAAFKAAFAREAGMPWEVGREQIILEKQNLARAYAEVSGTSLEASLGIMDHYRADYKVSIEDFAGMVKGYVDQQPAGFRLNFFVDEVGQYIANNVKLMTNLQTIAESLATKCRGQAWVFVTAQEDMDKVLGEMNPREATDFSKIQDRFRTRMKLTSANVDEVIQKRLLKKNDLGNSYLADLYERERNNFGTLFDFVDGATRYRIFQSEKDFQASYPFIPYQFALFQTAIENLSKHSAFEGRHSSVGERSMLGVFQQVVKTLVDAELGELATFDLMYEGIATTLKSQLQSAIRNANQHLGDEFALRVLKALFLVKYVKGFKATARNLRVLLHERFDQDFEGLRKRIAEALSLLEQQTYIQRNGEEYEFLTDEEKDVEQEIKHTEVDSGEVARTLEDILFTDIVKHTKMRFDPTKQDFAFTKKLDDRLIGREQELAIHFVTPFYEHHDALHLLKANALGRAELTVVLPPEARLVSDLLLYERTKKYVRMNQATAQQEAVRRILGEKNIQNQARYKNLREMIHALVSKGRLLVAGEEIEVSSEDPRARVVYGFNELVVKTYPHLRMLYGLQYTEADINHYLKITKNSLFGGETGDFSEAEQEMVAFIQANNRTGVRTTLKTLDEHFSRKPYGWYLAAIQCTVAKLCGRGKVEARADGTLLEDTALERALKNTHTFPNVILDPQIDFTAGQVRGLKDFYNQFFDRPASATEARALGRETGEAFRDLLNELERWQIQRYPFMGALNGLITQVKGLIGKPYGFFLTELRPFEDALFTQKEEVLDPIRQFMTGANKALYDEASRFLERESANFAEVGGDNSLLRTLLQDPACYRGDYMRTVKTTMDVLNAAIQKQLEGERQTTREMVSRLQAQLQGQADYGKLTGAQQQRLNEAFGEVTRSVEHQYLIPVIRDTRRKFEHETYLQLLNDMARWAKPPEPVGKKVKDKDPQIEYVTGQSLRVPFQKGVLENEDDVAAYLDALKGAMLQAIEDGKRIKI